MTVTVSEHYEIPELPKSMPFTPMSESLGAPAAFGASANAAIPAPEEPKGKKGGGSTKAK